MSATDVDMSKAVCLECSYALRELEEWRCPECGRGFDPGDSSTYRVPDVSGYWRRWAKPPSLIECYLVAAFTLLFLYQCSGPAGYEGVMTSPFLMSMLICGGPILILFVAWAYFGRILAIRKDRRMPIESARKGGHSRSRARWIPLPLLVIVVVSSFIYPWPMMIRFGLSQSAFEQAVKDYSAGRLNAPCRIGLYKVRAVEKSGGVVRFITGFSFIDPVGFEYDPTRPPSGPRFGVIGMSVGKGWFTFED